jgi:FkbM family methyltransferase
MFISDRVSVPNFGELTINVCENGTFSTINDFSINFEFIIVIKSLDTSLITHVMYHHCPVGYNNWTYNNELYFIKDIINKKHPGFSIEIYDNSMQTLLLSKNYHGTKNFVCLDLRSKHLDVTYPPYHTFFYKENFKNKCDVRDNDVIYDLGANVGAFSLYCSNFNIKKIYAFEPNPEVVPYLTENLNKYGKNTTVFDKAVLTEFKTVKLGSVESDSNTGGYFIADNGTIEVESINLESFVLKNNLELPTYLKIDIEGSEYDFFEKTSDDFFKKVRCIFLEFHNNDGKNILKIVERFKKMGYEIYHEPNALDYKISHMNTIYFKKL